MTVTCDFTILRGTYNACGVLLDQRVMGERALTRRVLALWEPGAEPQKCGFWLWVKWRSPRELDSRSAPGALVLSSGDFFHTIEPLDEWEEAPPAAGSLTLADRGKLILLPKE